MTKKLFSIIGIAGLVLLTTASFSFAYQKHINCGGNAYTAQNGDMYIADQEYTVENGAGYIDGNAASVSDPIDGTEDDPLYQSERWAVSEYKFDVPDGFYDVKLQFAETYFTEANGRIFNVWMEGNSILENLDIYSGVGHDTALDYIFTIKVIDGQLNITAFATKDNPKFSAISVVTSPTYYEKHINCGGEEYTDSYNNLYIADQEYSIENEAGYVDGNASSVADPIEGTEDDPLYQSERWAVSEYKFDVPYGYYKITLKFAETYFTESDRRRFNIWIEDGLVLENLDIYSEVGHDTALDYRFIVKVSDGQLNITTSSYIDTPKICAISVVTTSDYEKRINCGGNNYTTLSDNVYIPDQEYSAINGYGYIDGNTSSVTDPIAATEDDFLYQSDRWGISEYKFDVPDGFYDVTLKFAETYYDEINKRIFSVWLENELVLENIDLFGLVGHDTALEYTFAVEVADGQLNITASSEVDSPKFSAISAVSSKPQSTGSVQVSGRHIFVNDEPFFIKGVGYQPIPIGYCVGEYDIFSDSAIYNRDFAILQELHCNTIRTWAKITNSNFLDAAYNGGVDSIYVIMGFPVDNSLDLSNSSVRENIIDEFKLYVNNYKNHPAVLMWAIGNEQNQWYEGDITDWYTLVNEMAWAAYEVEGATYHPVTTPNGDIWHETGPIGNPDFKTDDLSMTYLDVWGANIYSGWSFQGRLQHYASLGSKPFWISEYGFPGTDQRNQGEGAYVLWDEMATNSDVCSGGTIMEYSDEWWKLDFPQKHDCSDGEEFWGIMSAEDNGAQPDIMHKKLAYFTLQDKWTAEEGRNLAFGKECYASSVEDPIKYGAANAVDGSLQTRWSSEFSDPQWIYIDLEESFNIGQVVLNWEVAYASEYEIQISDDAVEWETIYTVSNGDGYTDFIYIGEPVCGRYVRLYGIQKATQWGYSLREFEVYEPLPENAAENKTVFASSNEGEEYIASNAVDGNYTTRWSSQFSDPQWIYVNLGAAYEINQVILRWEAAYGKSYKIQKSMDGTTWVDVYTTTESDGTDDYIDFDPHFVAQYVRLYGTERATAYSYSLWEFQVIGIALAQ